MIAHDRGFHDDRADRHAAEGRIEELTLTMKLRRQPITQKYVAEIEKLYASPITDGVHEPVPVAEAAGNRPIPERTAR